jgi:drug/metabolite transporter (DMT)-like permease
VHRLIALAGTIGISFSAIFVRLADTAPTTAAVYRAGYALPALYLLHRVTRSRDSRPPTARRLAFASGLLLAVDFAAWHASIGLLGAGIATLVANLQVPLVGLTAWAVHRERPTTTAFAMIPIALVGVALLSGLGQEDAYGSDPVAGVLLGLLAAGAYSAFLLAFRHSNRGHLAPAAGPLFDATAGALAGSLIAAAFDSGFSLLPSWPAHGWLLALALGSQVASWLLITHALPRLAALETSALLLAQPAATMLWAGLSGRSP